MFGQGQCCVPARGWGDDSVHVEGASDAVAAQGGTVHVKFFG